MQNGFDLVKVELEKGGLPTPAMPDKRCRERSSTAADEEERPAVETPAPATGGRRQA
jgi:hypothetical protein